MAPAAPYVKLLRQLSSARDEYRSGALDITWDGGKASIFFVFGQPNHATFDSEDGRTLTGHEALTALVHELPRKFTVAPWRKAMVRTETLRITLDELLEPFAQMAGAATPDEPEAVPTGAGSTDDEIGTAYEVSIDFGLEDFPLLPLGQPLWSDAAANVMNLDMVVPKLPNSLIVLTGPKLRAAAVVGLGQVVDAVWVDSEEKASGEGAAMALMGAREGTVSGYQLDNPRMIEAITMLWRLPAAMQGLSAEWLSPDGLIAGLGRDRRDCAVLIDGADRGIALFMAGELVSCYSAASRAPEGGEALLRQLLAQPGATLTIRSRPVERASNGAHPAPVPPAAEPAPAPAAEPLAPPAAQPAAPQPARAADLEFVAAPAAEPASPAAPPPVEPAPSRWDMAIPRPTEPEPEPVPAPEVEPEPEPAAASPGAGEPVAATETEEPADPAEEPVPTFDLGGGDLASRLARASGPPEAAPAPPEFEAVPPAASTPEFASATPTWGSPAPAEAPGEPEPESAPAEAARPAAFQVWNPVQVGGESESAAEEPEAPAAADGTPTYGISFGAPAPETAAEVAPEAPAADPKLPDLSYLGSSPAPAEAPAPEEPAEPPAAEVPTWGAEPSPWGAPATPAASGAGQSALEAAFSGGPRPAVPDPSAFDEHVEDAYQEAEAAAAAAQPPAAPQYEPEPAPFAVAEAPAPPGTDFETARIDLDFEGIKDDLIKIGILWLGDADVTPVADLIRSTPPSVDDFVRTIDTIKGMTIAGHDPSVVRAMAREMHYHAAEFLCGA